MYGTLLATVAIDEEQGGTLKVYTGAMNLVATTIDAGWRKDRCYLALVRRQSERGWY